MKRRNFLQKASLSSFGVMATGTLSSRELPQNSLSLDHSSAKPIVIATWNVPNATSKAWEVLKNKGTALDAVEQGCRIEEADSLNFSVGKGGRPDRDGNVTLDACIMDHNGDYGAVVAVQNITHVISLARKVMEETPHVILAGKGAEKFGVEQGFKKENLKANYQYTHLSIPSTTNMKHFYGADEDEKNYMNETYFSFDKSVEAHIAKKLGYEVVEISTIDDNFFSAIFGLLKIRLGKIFLDNEDITNLLPQERVLKGMGYVPQTNNIFPTLSVQENLEMGAFIQHEDFSDILDYVYDLFPVLKEKRNQQAGELSGGQRQQVAVGRALMTKPKVLMLDEPSAGVSPIVMESLFQKIIEIAQQGTAVLMVEQNAKQALEISDRGYILVTGKNAYEGKGDYLLNDKEIRKAFLGG